MSDILIERCDVLIIGGGMATAWAAIAAAKAGAHTILVDKGYVGTSGVTATAGPNHTWIPPDPVRRREAIEWRGHEKAKSLSAPPPLRPAGTTAAQPARRKPL